MNFNRKCSENYCLGLDVGTASVGYCVIDENGKLFKINRKGDNGNDKRTISEKYKNLKKVGGDSKC